MYEQIGNNLFKTRALFLFFLVFVLGLGWVFGEANGSGLLGVAFAGVFALVSEFATYFYSDSIVLAVSGARPLGDSENPYLRNTVEGIAIAGGVPCPRIYIIDDPSPNAFATGRDPQHSAVAFTTGLVNMMNRQELEGVIAHELSHIKNYDIRLMAVAAVLVGTVTMLSDIFLRTGRHGFGGSGKRGGGGAIILVVAIVLAILSPFAAQVIRMAVSRNREYLADVSGAMLTRYPAGLASALRKLGDNIVPLKKSSNATAHLWIVQPLNIGGRVSRLFSTHPPLDDRIERLEKLAHKRADFSEGAMKKLGL